MMRLLFLCTILLNLTGASAQQESKLLPPDAGSGHALGTSVDIDGDYAVSGAPSDSCGAAYVFVRSGAAWTQQARLVPSDGAAGDEFGYDVAVSGDYAVVAARLHDNKCGAVYVFVRSGTTWTEQAKLQAGDKTPFDYFGCSMDMDGEYVIAGANGDDDYNTQSGSAYIFKRTGTAWAQQAKVLPGVIVAGGSFGSSVAIYGGYAVVGAPGAWSTAKQGGAGYIFQRSGTSWSLATGGFHPATTGEFHHFGTSVTIDSNRAVLCAPWGEGGLGGAYVYNNTAGSWSAGQVITPSDGETYTKFGCAVALAGSVLAVGAYEADSSYLDDMGAVHVFRLDSAWQELDVIRASDWDESDYLGRSVAAGGEYVIAGAPGDDDNGGNAGAAYVYYLRFTPEITSAAHVYAREGGLFTYTATAVDRDGDDVAYTFLNLPGWLSAADSSVSGTPPSGAAGDTSFTLVAGDGTYACSTSVRVTVGVQSVSEDSGFIASNAATYSYFGMAVHAAGDAFIVGAPEYDGHGTNSGAAYVYRRSGTDWTEERVLYSTEIAAYDKFGTSVAIDGSCAVVGAYGTDDYGSYTGAAYVFERTDTGWAQAAKWMAEDPGANQFYGGAVGVSGNYAAVGIQMDNTMGSQAGAVYVYHRSDSGWTQAAKLTAADLRGGERFGISVSLSGNRLLAGAYNGNGGKGAAYVFTRSEDGTWTETAQLVADDGEYNDEFGYQVSLSGSVAVVGASYDGDFTGSAYVFRPDGSGAWVQERKLTASDSAAGDQFGYAVSVSGNDIAVGSFKDDDFGEDAGAVYLFRYADGVWNERDKIVASDASGTGYFGYAAAVVGRAYALGCSWRHTSSTGKAYLYYLNRYAPVLAGDAAVSAPVEEHFAYGLAGTDGDGDPVAVTVTDLPAWLERDGDTLRGVPPAGRELTTDTVRITLSDGMRTADTAVHVFIPLRTLTDEAKLTAASPVAGTYFGVSVAVDGEYAAAGCIRDDTRADNAGAVHVFRKNGGGWENSAVLVPPDSVVDEELGTSVALCGSTLAAGAQSGGSGAGAVYVFGRTDSAWNLAALLEPSGGYAGDRFGTAVAVSDSFIIVGAPYSGYYGEEAGAAYAYVRAGSTWAFEGVLYPDRMWDRGHFGSSVAVSGNYAVVGAPQESVTGVQTGSAYLYVRVGGGWLFEQKLTAPVAVTQMNFGNAVALDGDRIAVGAYHDTQRYAQDGAVYTFVRNGTWGHEQTLYAADGGMQDYFGTSVGLADSSLVAGVPSSDAAAVGAGAVYAFTLADGVWKQDEKFTASDAAMNDGMGASVCVSGRTAVAGASADDAYAGALYVFGLNDAPRIDSPLRTDAVEEQAYTYVAEVTDLDGDGVTTGFADVPSWLAASGDTLYGTPDDPVADTQFTVFSTDGYDTGYAVVRITVAPVNDPPRFVSAAADTAVEEAVFGYRVLVDDPDNTPSVTITGLAGWLTAAGDSVYGTPDDPVADTQFTVIASDGELADTLTVMLTVVPVNDVPSVVSPAVDTAQEESPYRYVAAAFDPDNTPVIGFAGVPGWLTVNGDTLYGTPDDPAADTQFTVIASDGSAAGTLVVALAVTPVNDPPVITGAAADTATEDVPFAFVPAVDDPDDVPSVAYAGYPDWLSVSGDTLRGAPPEGRGDTSFTVTVTDGEYADTALVALTVVPVNDPPVITSPDSSDARTGFFYSYTATADDPDNADITFTYTVVPSWVVQSDAVLLGIPHQGATDTSFVLIASDGELADTLYVTVTVDGGTGTAHAGSVPNTVLDIRCADGLLTASFSVTERTYAGLALYDASGNERQRVLGGRFAPGTHRTAVRAAVPRGWYLLHGRIGDQRVSVRVLITD